MEAFKSKGLPVFDETPTSQEKLKELGNGVTSQFNFTTTKATASETSTVENLIIISICKNSESKDELVQNTEMLNKNAGNDSVLSVRLVVNNNINGVLKVGSAISDEDFNKYKEVFESIK